MVISTDFFKDNFYEICTFLIILFLGITLCIFGYNFSKNEEEKECFSYYKENGYILESCKDFEDKFNSIVMKK